MMDRINEWKYTTVYDEHGLIMMIPQESIYTKSQPNRYKTQTAFVYVLFLKSAPNDILQFSELKRMFAGLEFNVSYFKQWVSSVEIVLKASSTKKLFYFETIRALHPVHGVNFISIASYFANRSQEISLIL